MRREPLLLVRLGDTGLLAHPCPPDADRIAQLVADTAGLLDAERLAGAVWTYSPEGAW